MSIRDVKDALYPKLQRRIARSRRNPLVRKAALYSRIFTAWYENLDGDARHNGEFFVLDTLGRFDLKTIFDVGANVGEWTRRARSVFPGATIHAFEIAEATATELEQRLRGVPNVVVNRFGLSDQEGEITLKYYAEDNTLSTMIDYPHPGESVVTRARVVPGDAYVRDHGIDQVDFIKLDVEGAEHLVLAGLRETIAAGRVGAIQFEYGTVNILTKFLLHDYYQLLAAAGFVIGKIYPDYVDFREYRYEHEDFLGQNYLAVWAGRTDWIRALQGAG